MCQNCERGGLERVSHEEKLLLHVPMLSRYDFGIFRSPGPGLGNLLFPLARALKGAHDVGGVFVKPTMRQIKIGTVIRLEKDKRFYGDIFRPRSLDDWSYWITSKRVQLKKNNRQASSWSVVKYEGMGAQFHDLVGSDGLIREYLYGNSRLPIKDDQYDIAVHVRYGDFQPEKLSSAGQNTRLPIDWYREALDEAKRMSNKKKPRCMLFTDEQPEKIRHLLKDDSLEVEPGGNALTTLLAMSQAKIIVASRSTYSLWGQFLGRSVAIWPKGFELEKYKENDLQRDYFL